MILTEARPVETAQVRERVLVESRGGGWFCVAEIHHGDAELEAFTVSAYYYGRPRAGQVRARLAREGRWLAEGSKARMRRGEVLRVSALEWQPWP